MSKTPFMWKAEPGSTLDSAFSAQLGNVIYHVVSRTYGYWSARQFEAARPRILRQDGAG